MSEGLGIIDWEAILLLFNLNFWKQIFFNTI